MKKHETNGRTRQKRKIVEYTSQYGTVRAILRGMMFDKKVLEPIALQWQDRGLFASKPANAVAQAAVNHWKKHQTVVEDAITWLDSLQKSKKISDKELESIEQLWQETLKAPDHTTDHVLEEAEKYFQRTQIDLLNDRIDTLRTSGRYEEAARELSEFNDFALDQSEDLRMSAIKPAHTRWLMKPYLAVGTVTLLEGDPDAGKTMICCDMISRLTNGYPPPPAAPDTGKPRKPKNVLYVTSEGSMKTSIIPRLIAAGADMDRVFRWPVTDWLSFPSGIGKLRRLMRKNDIRVVILDPVKSFMDPGLSDDKQIDVRRVTDSVSRLADDTDTAFLFIRHFVKSRGGMLAMHAGAGSGAWTQAARLQYLAIKQDERTHFLKASKGNDLPPKERRAVKFCIDSKNLTFDGKTKPIGRVQWGRRLATKEDQSADDYMKPQKIKSKSNNKTVKRIIETLKRNQGSMESEKLKQTITESLGVSEKTYKRACSIAGVKRVRRGYGRAGKWFTSLENNPKHSTRQK